MENNSSHLEISRQFNCSKESLYEAWTAPEQLRKWWKPMGKELEEVENNVSNGGNLRYNFAKNSLLIDGKYEKVIDADFLEYSWNWHLQAEAIQDAAYTLTVKFQGECNHAEIMITQQGFQSEEHIQPHRLGWEQALDQLDKFVNENQQLDIVINQRENAPITGYNETPEQQKVGGG